MCFIYAIYITWLQGRIHVAFPVNNEVYVIIYTGYRGDEHNKATRAERILLNCDYEQLSKTITKLHPIINKHINFDTLIPFLSSYCIFTDDEMEFLMNIHKTKAEKVNKLITSLPTKDQDGIHNFVKALNDAHEHSGHDVILDNLKEQLFS